MSTSTKLKEVGIPLTVLIAILASVVLGGRWAGNIETELKNVIEDVSKLNEKVDLLLGIPGGWRGFNG